MNDNLKKLLKKISYVFLSASFATGVFAATAAATTSAVTKPIPPVLTNFSQNIRLTTPLSQSVISKKILLTANVTNIGNQTWYGYVNATETPDSTNLVYLRTQWFDAKGNLVSMSAIPLGKNVLPNQTITFNFYTTTPSNPGTYTLRLSMSQQGVAWFYQKGGVPLNTSVNITAN